MTEADEREHMRDCEARTVLAWPRPRREDYYREVLLHRKRTGLDDLIRRIKIQYAIKQGAK